MALSLETTIQASAITGRAFPSGYTAPATTHTFTDASVTETKTWTIAASGNTDASTASTGLTAAVSAVDTYCSGTYVPTLGLDLTNTIEMICTITRIRRELTGTETTNVGITGTDNYIINVSLQWEKA